MHHADIPRTCAALGGSADRNRLAEKRAREVNTAGHMQVFSGFCLNTSCKHLVLFIITECSEKC